MSARELNELIAESHHERKQQDFDQRTNKHGRNASRESQKERINKEGDENTDDQHQDKEGRTASGMEASLPSHVLYRQRQTVLIAEDRLMLRTVILEGPANILHQRNEQHI